MLMLNENFYKNWLTVPNRQKNVFTDFVDGDCYLSSNFFKENHKALQIILYQDAFEVCNPLGSSRKIHKIIGVYMTIANVPPYNRTKVDQIQLVALCLEKHVQTFGFQQVLQPIIRDIKQMESEGIEIKGEILKGTVISVVGDNLGSHQIGGFVENFSTTEQSCRFCQATKDTLNCKITGKLKKFAKRTVSSYDADATMALINCRTVNGVKCNSVLNELNFFHVCNPGLPPCMAHDIFEGVMPYDFMLCINYLISKKYYPSCTKFKRTKHSIAA